MSEIGELTPKQRRRIVDTLTRARAFGYAVTLNSGAEGKDAGLTGRWSEQDFDGDQIRRFVDYPALTGGGVQCQHPRRPVFALDLDAPLGEQPDPVRELARLATCKSVTRPGAGRMHLVFDAANLSFRVGSSSAKIRRAWPGAQLDLKGYHAMIRIAAVNRDGSVVDFDSSQPVSTPPPWLVELLPVHGATLRVRRETAAEWIVAMSWHGDYAESLIDGPIQTYRRRKYVENAKRHFAIMAAVAYAVSDTAAMLYPADFAYDRLLYEFEQDCRQADRWHDRRHADYDDAWRANIARLDPDVENTLAWDVEVKRLRFHGTTWDRDEFDDWVERIRQATEEAEVGE